MKKATTSSSKGPQKPLSATDRISPQDFQDLKKAFDAFDQDGSGSIDASQIDKAMQELGLKGRNPIVAVICEGLHSRQKAIRFDEFLQIVVDMVGDTKTEDGLRRIFSIYDKNGDGIIDLEQFKLIARELGETMNEEEIIELMHNSYILNNTHSNEGFTWEEFRQVVGKRMKI